VSAVPARWDDSVVLAASVAPVRSDDSLAGHPAVQQVHWVDCFVQAVVSPLPLALYSAAQCAEGFPVAAAQTTVSEAPVDASLPLAAALPPREVVLALAVMPPTHWFSPVAPELHV
jgi:hypothetical protein